MRAVRIHRHGGPEVLQIERLEKPVPGPDEALVRIRAAALNHLDLWVRNGLPGIPLPLIPGSDAAGVIEEIGRKSSQSDFKPGDEVILIPYRCCRKCSFCLDGNENLCRQFQIVGEHIQGFQAEYVVVPFYFLLPRPKSISWEASAAFPLVYLTAWHMLHRKAGIRKGDRVLIWGASSGVGSAAIQIARDAGATVITTAGTERKAAFGKELGAGHAINYHSENVGSRVLELTDGEGVDIVFEHVGLEAWAHSLKALRHGGTLVTCGATTGAVVRVDLRHLFIKRQRIIGSTMGDRNDLIRLIGLIEAKRIRPVYSHVLPLDDVRQAHEILAKGENLGKVVLSLADQS